MAYIAWSRVSAARAGSNVSSRSGSGRAVNAVRAVSRTRRNAAASSVDRSVATFCSSGRRSVPAATPPTRPASGTDRESAAAVARLRNSGFPATLTRIVWYRPACRCSRTAASSPVGTPSTSTAGDPPTRGTRLASRSSRIRKLFRYPGAAGVSNVRVATGPSTAIDSTAVESSSGFPDSSRNRRSSMTWTRSGSFSVVRTRNDFDWPDGSVSSTSAR